MQRRQFLSSLAAAAATPALAQQRRPNIVFILADDLGYGDVGCYGQKEILTPNIDRLATEGIRFSSAYAGDAECAPSRCTLMTGLHTGHSRVRANSPITIPLKPEDLTYTEILHKAGYRTALYGKWSLGGLGSTGYPTRKGIDDWFGYFNQLHAQNYYPELMLEGEQEFMLMGNTGTSHKQYTADLFTERAIHFLEQNKDRPFCLNLCYTIPHSNNATFRDTGNGMEVPNDAPYSDRPWSQIEKNFAAMVTHLDSDVGKVLGALKRLGLDGNTIVVFTSDNGPHKAGGHSPAFFHSGGPLRGIKFQLYEGGIRVPAIVRGPGIAPGKVSDYPWAFWDVMPTLAEIAGAAVPKGIDGISIAPLLFGHAQKPHPYFYWEQFAPSFVQAVRLDDWKGVRKGIKAPLELYNLREDLAESTDLASKNPEMVRKLEAILHDARVDSKDYPINGPRPSAQ